MKVHTFIIGCALTLAVFLFAQQRRPELTQVGGFKAVMDLTHPINGDVPPFDLAEKADYHVEVTATVAKDKYFTRNVSLPEHFGTHIDAPAHFVPGLWTVDQIPPERLIAPLAVLDVSANVKSDPDYRISVEDIAKWEQLHGHIPQNSILLARTGWESRWNSVKDYRNADAKNIMHFPGFSVEAAKFLVETRGVMGLGIDTLSVDYGESQDFAVHQYAMPHSVYNLENVANLEHVPPTGSIVMVAPMKLEGGSGGPVRLLALVR